MDKTTIGLIVAVGALAVSPALASAPADVTEQILKPRTVAELLEPIPQPVETLAKVQAAQQLEGVEVAQIEVNPYGVTLGHRHHHHHHYNYHHHHHHHYRNHHHQYYNNYNNNY